MSVCWGEENKTGSEFTPVLGFKNRERGDVRTSFSYTQYLSQVLSLLLSCRDRSYERERGDVEKKLTDPKEEREDSDDF